MHFLDPRLRGDDELAIVFTALVSAPGQMAKFCCWLGRHPCIPHCAQEDVITFYERTSWVRSSLPRFYLCSISPRYLCCAAS